MWQGWPSELQQPDRPARDARIHRGLSLLRSASSAVARRSIVLVANVRPVQRSCRDDPLVPASTPPPKSPPGLSLSPPPAPRNRGLHMHRSPALATPSDPTYRSASMAASANTHKPQVPYAPAPANLNPAA